MGLKVNASPGNDGIAASDIIKIVHLIAPVLTNIFNKAIHESTFPKSLKSSIFRKLFEKLIKNDKNQFGFQEKSSTDSALCEVVHKINKFTDQGRTLY